MIDKCYKNKDEDTISSCLRKDLGEEYEFCSESNNGCWKDNIHVVRDLQHSDLWLVVIDRLSELDNDDADSIPANEEYTNKEIDILLDFSRNYNMELRDILETWIKGSVAFLYRLDYFCSTYGKIINYPTKKYFTNNGFNGPLDLEEEKQSCG